jgi:ATP-binding cassette subfamily F protein uup
VQAFVGGYSDWARWRDARDAQRATARTASAARPAAAATAPARRKLSYKEQRELDALPAQLESLETERAGLQAKMADPKFYSREQAEVAAKLKELADIEARIEVAFARWSDLESR